MRFNQEQGSAIARTEVMVICSGSDKCQSKDCNHRIPHRYLFACCDPTCPLTGNYMECLPVNSIVVFNEREIT